jgi:hypothetical protein
MAMAKKVLPFCILQKTLLPFCSPFSGKVVPFCIKIASLFCKMESKIAIRYSAFLGMAKKQ